MKTSLKSPQFYWITLFGFLLISQIQGQQTFQFENTDKVLDKKRRLLGGDICALILKDHKIIYTYTAGDYNKDTQEKIASCSKWLTAALVMTFVDEGKIALNDPVCKYLPEFSKDGKDKILIRHCLSHTTGILTEKFSFASFRERKKFNTLAEEVNSFAQLPLAGEPGTVFAYGNAGLNTAAHILEKISGKDFETLFRERIAQPLGMEHTTFVGDQIVNPSGSATSTPTDYIRFLDMILNNGIYNGKRIISQNAVEWMQQSSTENCKILYTPAQAEGLEYGFGEWIHRKDSNGRGIVVSSPGLFGTFPYIDRENNFAAIIFVKNLRIFQRKQTYTDIMQAIEKTMKGLK